MKELLKKISSEELLKQAAEILKAAFNSNNMGLKYELFHEAEDLKKIAKILYKYELMQQKGDFHR